MPVKYKFPRANEIGKNEPVPLKNAVIGQAPLTTPRGDGFNDGVNVVQGVRVYDATLGGWSTPDAYQGEVHDPMSQKSYIWNGNNAVAFADPSGYDAANTQSLFVDSGETGSGDANALPDDGQTYDAYQQFIDANGVSHLVAAGQITIQGTAERLLTA